MEQQLLEVDERERQQHQAARLEHLLAKFGW